MSKIKRRKGVALPQVYWSPVIIQKLCCPPSPDRDAPIRPAGGSAVPCSFLKYRSPVKGFSLERNLTQGQLLLVK